MGDAPVQGFKNHVQGDGSQTNRAGFENTDDGRVKAAVAMESGETFTHHEYTLMWDPTYLPVGESPFRCVRGTYNEPIKSLWMGVDEWSVVTPWEEDVSPKNPRWCKVGNSKKADKNKKGATFTQIIGYVKGREFPYICSAGNPSWKYAIPVSDAVAEVLQNFSDSHGLNIEADNGN